MDFKLQMGRLLGILGIYLSIFFYVAFFVMCITMGYFFHVWGGVGAFFFVFLLFFLFCTEVFLY